MSRRAVSELIKKAIVESADDPAYFGRFFLRKWFPLPMPPFHLGLLALFTRKVSFLDKYPEAHEFLLNEFKYKADPADPASVDIPVFYKSEDGSILMAAGTNNAIIVPRGFSKTTLFKLAFIYDLCTDPNTFGVYVSESGDHAKRQLGDIKKQFERNQLLREAYGNLVPQRNEAEKWGAEEIQLSNGAILVARGRGSQVRGLLYDGNRPNKILLDDVEDRESVSTDAQRTKVSDWFYGDVVPAGNQMEVELPEEFAQQDLQITVVGTLLGADALLMNLQQDMTFSHIVFGVVARWNETKQVVDGEEIVTRTTPRLMLWPDKMSAETYLFKREVYRRAGKLAEFAREYDSQIRVEEDALFGYFPAKFYIPPAFAELIQVAIAGDPAISEQPDRDHSALVATARHQNGLLWVLDVWGKLGASPREIIDKLFEWVGRYAALGLLPQVGIEAQQYQKSLIFIAREEMARKQRFFNIKPIFQGNDKTKDDRISGILQPRYASGYMRHARPFPQLEAQLEDFPNGKKDYIDAEAMSLQLLGETSFTAAPDDSVVTHDEYDALEPALPALYSGTHSTGQAWDVGESPLRNGRYG